MSNIPIGFHGDQNLIKVIEEAVDGSDFFLETGSHIGRSLKFISSKFPEKHFFSCEIEKDKYLSARDNCSNQDNVTIENLNSEDFLESVLEDFDFKNSTFWLDAHWSSSNISMNRSDIKKHSNQPLKNELEIITKNLDEAKIFIDDMVVPHNDTFLYDVYGGIESSFENVQESILWEKFTLIYPDYDPNFDTMYHNPKGWCLIVKGNFDEQINEKFNSVTRSYNIE